MDAAVATAFALAVVHPAAGNLGGGGFLLSRPAEGQPSMMDFRETAPMAAEPRMWLKDGAYDEDRHHRSLASVGVPGTVAGLHEAWRREGRLAWARLLRPAIRLARDGFVLSENQAASLAEQLPEFRKHGPTLAQFSRQTLKASAHKFAETVMRPVSIEIDKMSVDDAFAPQSPFWDFMRKAYKLGYHKLPFPEVVGGPGLTPWQIALVMEELGLGELRPDPGPQYQSRAAVAVEGGEEFIKTFTVPYCQNTDASYIGCWAITEPDHGSDTLMAGYPSFRDPNIKAQCRARQDGDAYVINGQKAAWVSGGPIAKTILLMAQVEPSMGHAGSGIFVFSLDRPGVSKGKALNKIGTRDLPQGEIYFHDARGLSHRWRGVQKHRYFQPAGRVGDHRPDPHPAAASRRQRLRRPHLQPLQHAHHRQYPRRDRHLLKHHHARHHRPNHRAGADPGRRRYRHLSDQQPQGIISSLDVGLLIQRPAHLRPRDHPDQPQRHAHPAVREPGRDSPPTGWASARSISA